MIEWDKTVMLTLYKHSKSASVGSIVTCPTCKKNFTKTHYQQVFCGTRGNKNSNGKKTMCKDQYCNYMGGLINTTKIVK